MDKLGHITLLGIQNKPTRAYVLGIIKSSTGHSFLSGDLRNSAIYVIAAGYSVAYWLGTGVLAFFAPTSLALSFE